MRIGEIAELTGLSISNIRFYEKKGLLEPARGTENKYREYTEADLQRLKEIMLYRKMNLSIEQITNILQSKISLEEAVRQQLSNLEQEKEILEGSIALCQKVLKDGNSETHNLDYYLNYVKEEESKGTKFAQLDELLDDFAEFVHLERLWGDPYIGRLLLNKKLFRLFSGLAVLGLMLLPALVVWDSYKDHGEIRRGAIVFCAIWIVAEIAPFVSYRLRNRFKH